MDNYIKHYIDHYKANGKTGSGVGLGNKRAFLNQAGYKDTMSLLDYGCGWGAILQGANPKDYLGVDIVPQAIEIARQEFPDRKFEVLELGKLKTKKYDMVIALSVFTHTPQAIVQKSIKDIKQGLKKDGVVLMDILAGTKPGSRHITYWDLGDFDNILADNGFHMEDSFVYNAPNGYTHTYLILKL